MRLLVVKAFIDKHTGVPYNAGYYYESDDLERIKELQELGYLEKVPVRTGEPEQAVAVKPVRSGRRHKA
ncbi:MAG: hypothetical protein AB7D26_10065 [Marinobacterium sp.]